MTAARITGAVVLLLLLGAIVWAGFLHFVGNGTDPAAELAVRTERNLQVLLDGLAEGRILYFKTEDFRTTRIIPSHADPPQQVIIESWLQSGVGEERAITVAIMRSREGELLQYTQASDEKYTITIASTGETWDMNGVWHSPVEWVEETWKWPRYLATAPDAEFTGNGELNGMVSLVYELSSDSRRERFELVEDAPLLSRRSTYQIDDEGKETLTAEQTVVEYRLLPAGSSIPPPSQDWPNR